MRRIITVVGNRPQFVKAAIVAKQWGESGLDEKIQNYLVHTGQHYDPMLSDIFFQELGLPEPDHNLMMGSGPVIDQIGAMLPSLRAVFQDQQPDAVLVYGDTNSTIAAALTAAHLHLPLFHVEAGERNFRRFQAPEEVNRIVTDELAWRCLTSTEKAYHYLLREGFSRNRVSWVGDPMFDLFCWAQGQLDRHSRIELNDLGLTKGQYILATIHRNENSSEQARLLDLLSALDRAPQQVILPIHPRVRNLLDQWKWAPSQSLKILDPLGYFDLLAVLRDCAVCVTDSGGLAREAFFAGKPSIIPMPNSGWNEIVEAGWARVVPGSGDDLLKEINNFRPHHHRPEGLFGDGRASERIGQDILNTLDGLGPEGEWHPLGNFFAIPQPRDRSRFTFDALASELKELERTGCKIVPIQAPKSGGTELSVIYIVDGDLNSVLKLGQVHKNASQAVTFAFRPDGIVYNLLSPEVLGYMTALSEQGHELALILDSGTRDESGRYVEAMNTVLEGRIRWVLQGDKLVDVEGEGATSFDGRLEWCQDREVPHTAVAMELTEGRHVIVTNTGSWNEVPLSLFEGKQRLITARRLGMERELQLSF